MYWLTRPPPQLPQVSEQDALLVRYPAGQGAQELKAGPSSSQVDWFSTPAPQLPQPSVHVRDEG